MRRAWPLLLALLLAGCATGGAGPRDENRDLVPTPEAAQPNALLGIEFIKQGDNAQALYHLKRALVHDPQLVLAHNAIGVLYERLEEYELAEKHFRTAAQLAPSDSDALNNYGRLLCNRGRYAEAEQRFQQALQNPVYRTPQNTFTNLGLCALKAGDSGKAEHYFRQALGKAPRFPPALFELAKLNWAQGNGLQARAYLQRLAAVIPLTAEVLWLGVQVERALGDRDAEASYALQLRNTYPDSAEARQLSSMVPK
ncbi:MAG TPA: type IV pilus biogenesis/stability protein PilW [Gammaproteobacteria bacterium]